MMEELLLRPYRQYLTNGLPIGFGGKDLEERRKSSACSLHLGTEPRAACALGPAVYLCEGSFGGDEEICTPPQE